MTAIEAYNLFKKKFPDAKTETIFDWGDFYTCSKYFNGDMTDDEYRINKTTGEITEFDFADYIEELDKRGDEEIVEIKVKDLLR